jgi:hypothetical protein
MQIETVKYLNTRFQAHAEELNVDCVRVNPEDWDLVENPDNNPRISLGYLAPVPGEYPLFYCPEILAGLADDAEALETERLADVVLFMIDLEIIHHEKPLTERLSLSHDLLAEAAEGAMQMFTSYHLLALDCQS